MRAALHESWPALSYHFGLTPKDVPDLSSAEWALYVNAARELNEG